MISLVSAGSKFALVSAFFAQTAWSQNCISFGVDFQSDGSYFQNSLSNDSFTFVSRFEGIQQSFFSSSFAKSSCVGCLNDVANNILVDPTGNELQCSNTNLQPNDTPELSTW